MEIIITIINFISAICFFWLMVWWFKQKNKSYSSDRLAGKSDDIQKQFIYNYLNKTSNSIIFQIDRILTGIKNARGLQQESHQPRNNKTNQTRSNNKANSKRPKQD